MSPAQYSVITFLETRKDCRFSASDVARATGYATSTTREALNCLLTMGLVQRAVTYSGELGWMVRS